MAKPNQRRMLRLGAVLVAMTLLGAVAVAEPASAVPSKHDRITDKITWSGPGAAPTYSVDIGAKASPIRPMAYGYDPIRFNECLGNQQSFTRSGWVKNHYAFCRVEQHVTTVTIDGEPAGLAAWRLVLIGEGSFTSRQVTFTATIDGVRAEGAADAIVMTTSLVCEGGPGGCDITPVTGWSKPLLAWNNTSVGFFASSPDSGDGPEKIARGTFRAVHLLEAACCDPFVSNGEKSSIRFDSAPYMEQGHRQGAIFDKTTPSLLYDTNNPDVDDVARHIQKAKTDPRSTFPPVPNKAIPDRLHRWRPANDADYNARVDNNRAIARMTCQIYWPNYSTNGQSCDEYPFASTFEGAARFQYLPPAPGGMYSAQPVDVNDNNKAGNALQRWYFEDRILHNDEFFVRIQ